MTEQAIQIIGAIVLACIPIVIPFVLGLIKARMDAKQWDTAVLLVRQIVTAAEQVGAVYGWTSEEKKAYALTQAAAAFKMDEALLDSIIEAAVAQLKMWGDELVKNGRGVVVKGMCEGDA